MFDRRRLSGADCCIDVSWVHTIDVVESVRGSSRLLINADHKSLDEAYAIQVARVKLQSYYRIPSGKLT